MAIIVWVLALAVVGVIVVLIVDIFYLRGSDLSAYDASTGQRHGVGSAPSAEHLAVVASLREIFDSLKRTPRSQHLALLRTTMDNAFPDVGGSTRFTSVDVLGIPAEWVLAQGADPRRRLLYLHGGAYMVGSAKSHRRLTAKFSEMAHAAVLAIDYRMMPEHPRLAGVDDSRTAYRWLLEHGPDGAGMADAIFVAGDSAGGNLTLSLIAWLRDQGLRAPNAAVALSPATDTTCSSPSLTSNLASDALLGPLFRSLAQVPRPLLRWGAWFGNRVRPSHPVVSPVFGDLSNLPPLLVQASEAEILLDDSRRYVNKAVAAGSPVRLQTWSHMVHVWQIFYPELAEGREALEEIRQFLETIAPADSRQPKD